VSFEPELEVPLLLLAVRDELLVRPWEPPAEHWPEFPGLIGGRDLAAGGTWLAVDPSAHRVGFLLNGKGTLALEHGRRSRGELPLLAAAGKPLPTDLTPFDPFYLVSAGPTGGVMLSWDGLNQGHTRLPAATSVIVNSGIDPTEPRAAELLSTLDTVERPDPLSGWDSWLALAAGTGVDRQDPRALILRHTFGDDLRYGSSSVSFVALSASYVRYDFAVVPEEPGPLSLIQIVNSRD
jgi:hypothetical protein